MLLDQHLLAGGDRWHELLLSHFLLLVVQPNNFEHAEGTVRTSCEEGRVVVTELDGGNRLGVGLVSSRNFEGRVLDNLDASRLAGFI